MGNFLLDLFIDIEQLPYDFYGTVQLLFHFVAYFYVYFRAIYMINYGSNLFLLRPKWQNFYGSVMIPFISCTPDFLVIICSCFGETSEARDYISMGVGSISGQVIMAVTLPWAIIIFTAAERLPVEYLSEKSKRLINKKNKSIWDRIHSHLFDKGIIVSNIVQKNVWFIVVSSFVNGCTREGEDCGPNEQYYVLVSFIICCVNFIAYWLCEYFIFGESDYRSVHKEEVIAQSIESGLISLSSIFAENITSLSVSEQEHGGEAYEAIYTSIQRVARRFFNNYDIEAKGTINHEEMAFLLRDLGDEITGDALKQLFQRYDLDQDGQFSFEEFCLMVFDLYECKITTGMGMNDLDTALMTKGRSPQLQDNRGENSNHQSPQQVNTSYYPPSVSPPTSSYLDHHSSIPIGSYNQHDLSLFPEHKQSMGGTSENSYDNYRGDTSDEEIETYSPKEATAKSFSDSFLPHPLFSHGDINNSSDDEYEEENGRPKSKEPSNKNKEKHVTDNDSHSSLAHSPLAVEYDENSISQEKNEVDEDGNTIPHSSQSNRIDDPLLSNSPIHISPPDSRGNNNTPPSYAYTSDDVNYSEIDKDIDSVEIPSKDSNNRGYVETKKPSKYFPKSSIEYVSLSSQSTITPHSPLSPLPAHMNTIKEEKEDIYKLKPFRATIDVHSVLHSKYRAKSQECCVNRGNDLTHRHNASIPMEEGHKGHHPDIERGLNEIEVDLDTENQLDMDDEDIFRQYKGINTTPTTTNYIQYNPQRIKENEKKQLKSIVPKSYIYLFGGWIIMIFFCYPMVYAFCEIATRMNISPFYVNFFVSPCIAYLRDFNDYRVFAFRRTVRVSSASIALVQGMIIINNIMNIGLFLGTVYFRNLEWRFTGEMLGMLATEIPCLFLSLVKVERTYLAYVFIIIFLISFYTIYFMFESGFN
ncbi:hypothetical protein WA158_004394 [Blastocystis sp. Blastoise]